MLTADRDWLAKSLDQVQAHAARPKTRTRTSAPPAPPCKR